MRKLIDRIRGRSPELSVPHTYLQITPEEATRASSMLLDAYFQGVDPITNTKLSNELRDALGTVALPQLIAEINANVQARTHEAQVIEFPLKMEQTK